MLLFRIVCAVLMAWAVSWVLGLPEARTLVLGMPEMEFFGPLAAAFVGAFSLAKRQGWGMIVALSNGVWSGLYAIVVSGALYTTYLVIAVVGPAGNGESSLMLLEHALDPLFAQSLNYPLILQTILATAAVGLVTEAIHWGLVQLRRSRAEGFRSSEAARINLHDFW